MKSKSPLLEISCFRVECVHWDLLHYFVQDDFSTCEDLLPRLRSSETRLRVSCRDPPRDVGLLRTPSRVQGSCVYLPSLTGFGSPSSKV